jgi:hypothetical protein
VTDPAGVVVLMTLISLVLVVASGRPLLGTFGPGADIGAVVHQTVAPASLGVRLIPGGGPG